MECMIAGWGSLQKVLNSDIITIIDKNIITITFQGSGNFHHKLQKLEMKIANNKACNIEEKGMLCAGPLEGEGDFCTVRK